MKTKMTVLILLFFAFLQTCLPQQCARQRMRFKYMIGKRYVPTNKRNEALLVSPFNSKEKCFSLCRETTGCKSCIFLGHEGNCILYDYDRYETTATLEYFHDLHYYESIACEKEKENLVKFPVPETSDCLDVYNRGYKESGIYEIGNRFRYCQMNYHGGGWTVVVKRFNGAEKFNRSWSEYASGFGNLRSEFWMGNEFLHRQTKDYKNEVLFVMKTFYEDTLYMALYDGFSVGDNSSGYVLTTGTYKSDGIQAPAGDSFHYHNGLQFYTYDRDNEDDCAKSFSAWWLLKCHQVSFNGEYSTTGSCLMGKCINWFPFISYEESLQEAMMLIRRKYE